MLKPNATILMHFFTWGKGHFHTFLKLTNSSKPDIVCELPSDLEVCEYSRVGGHSEKVLFATASGQQEKLF